MTGWTIAAVVSLLIFLVGLMNYRKDFGGTADPMGRGLKWELTENPAIGMFMMMCGSFALIICALKLVRLL